MPLTLVDLNHLHAAQGYSELGMLIDADAELDLITPDVRHLPEVLEVRLEHTSRMLLLPSASRKMRILSSVVYRLPFIFVWVLSWPPD